MELLAPAGNLEKLYYAYAYGADAAYIGIKNFSLRARADNFHEDEWKKILDIKGSKKLYGALNIFFNNADLKNLEAQIDYLSKFPFDAFIISDLGLLPLLKKYFPDRELHLSTQANCTNIESAGIYQDLGFSRIIPARETSLTEIAEIKNRYPDLEIEAFVHGAMCMAYSGRCFLSSFLSDRSANKGDCAHTCRWKYKVTQNPGEIALEEEERPGELFPLIEGDNFTTILSSKDLCMIDYLKELRDAGVDVLKIEGRMKSIYYTAVITRTYRKALEALESGTSSQSWEEYKKELFSVSHRDFSTGFFFDDENIQIPTDKSYLRTHLFLGSVGEHVGDGVYKLIVKNQIKADSPVEYIGPEILYKNDAAFTLFDEKMQPVQKANHGKDFFLKPSTPVQKGYILRRKIPHTGI